MLLKKKCWLKLVPLSACTLSALQSGKTIKIDHFMFNNNFLSGSKTHHNVPVFTRGDLVFNYDGTLCFALLPYRPCTYLRKMQEKCHD